MWFTGTHYCANLLPLFLPVSFDHSTCMCTHSAAMARSATGSVSICWGRVNQILNRQLLVNFYSDFGSSGGAVLDRDG